MPTSRQVRFLPAKDILGPFHDLSKDDVIVRITAIQNLISRLKTTTEDRNATIEYTLTRLLKGLNSGHDSSRLGFSMALTEFLREFVFSSSANELDLHFNGVIKKLLQETEPSSNISGQEGREYYFGRLFGLKSIIASQCLFKSDSDPSHWRIVLQQLFDLGQKKPWLWETCSFTIHEAIGSIPKDMKDLIDVTYSEWQKSQLVDTPGGIALLLQFYRLELDQQITDIKPHPLSRSNLNHLSKVLRESEAESESEKGKNGKQKGSWTPRLPYVCQTILDGYNAQLFGNHDVASFEEFWKAVVDEGFFAAKSSDERKFWGFELACMVVKLDNLRTDLLEAIFSKNLMKCFMNHLADQSRYLHKAATKLLKAIQDLVATGPQYVPIIVQAFVCKNGSQNFDVVTKTKTVEKLMVKADEEGLAQITRIYGEIIRNPSETDVKAIERRRQWAADQILTLIRSNQTTKSEDWVQGVLRLFAEYGYFDIATVSADVAVTPATQSMFRLRLMSCLNALFDNTELNRGSIVYSVVRFLDATAERSGMEFIIQLSDDMQESIDSSKKTLKKIHKKIESLETPQPHFHAFQLLFSLVLLQVYNGDADAFSVLEELQICYDKVKDAKKSSTHKSHEPRVKRRKHDHDHDTDDAEDQTIASDMLMEIILSFSAKPSALLKKLATNVFSTFAKDITQQGLQSMVNVLETKESLAGQNELFDQEDDDEESEAGSEEDELDSDVEFVDNEEMVDVLPGSDESKANSEDDDDDDDDDESEEEIDDMDEEEAKKLEEALAKALGTNKLDMNGDTKMADENNSNSDESMDDEQMLALDEHLVNIFKQRKAASAASATKKQQQKEGKETIINFKSRVLDLLEIYVKQCHTNPLVLELLLPLLILIRTTTTKQIADKAQNVVKSLMQASRGKGGAGVNNNNTNGVSSTGKSKKKSKDKDNAETLEKSSHFPTVTSPRDLLKALLPAIHAEAAANSKSRNNAKEHAAACSQCSLFVVKVLVYADDAYLDKVFDVYKKSMVRWMREDGFEVPTSFFTDLVNWAGSVRNNFVKKKSGQDE